jgi:uncharacterized phage infection (PIP) family protein YhgE
LKNQIDKEKKELARNG